MQGKATPLVICSRKTMQMKALLMMSTVRHDAVSAHAHLAICILAASAGQDLRVHMELAPAGQGNAAGDMQPPPLPLPALLLTQRVHHLRTLLEITAAAARQAETAVSLEVEAWPLQV